MNQDLKSQSQWLTVTDLMQTQSPISLGKTGSYWYLQDPKKMLYSLTYYKLATKLIGKSKNVLDVGCGEGFGTFLLGKECGRAKGVDCDAEVITIGQNNFTENFIEFVQGNILTFKSEDQFDAIVCFSVIEHIAAQSSQAFWKTLLQQLKPEGLLILGTSSPNCCFSSKDKKAPPNPYTHEGLEAEISSHFEYVFPFGANGEVIHTSCLSSAEYYIVLGCKQKR